MTTYPAGANVGPYRIVGLVGAGGMGEVYRAIDTRLDREVAIKVLRGQRTDVERNERLRREARVLSALKHPHICAVHDIVEVDGLSLIVMEYVEGETLAARIARRHLPVGVAVGYARQLASALDAAHSQGIIHCDVKPANIIVTDRGLKLLDFGIATAPGVIGASSGNTDVSTVTDSGGVPGTTAYMAPEQLDGAQPDARSDIFALGIVTYEMLEGHKPFDAPTRARMIAAILEHEPTPLSGVGERISPALERAVMKCLGKQPRDRWQTARDLESELAWVETASLPVPHAAATRPRLAWAALAAVLVAAVALTAYLRSGSTTAPANLPVRFLAAGPPGSVITANAGAFAVSPDGKHLAFTASLGGGPRMLWIRALDSFDAHSLAGTDGAAFPFWAPDSNNIAFFSGDQLKRIGTDGRSLQVVTSVPTDAEWGSWSNRGDILFTNGDMYHVRASGGTAERILSKEKMQGGVGGPEFLPDGVHFLLGFVEPEKSVEQVSIYVGRLDNPLERLLVRADSQAAYSEPGYIFYSSNGSLVAHAFDPKTQMTVGEPVTIPEPVAFVRSQRRASFAISQTGVLAYREGATTTQLTWYDRAGHKLGIVGTPARYVNPAIAPDGQRIAVTRLAPSITESDVWVFEPRGERQLTSATGWDDYAVWSPDGDRIAYASNHTGFMDLYLKDATASGDDQGTLLVKNRRRKLPMDWTSNGERLVFLDVFGAPGFRRPSSIWFDKTGQPRVPHDGAAETPEPARAQASASPPPSTRSEDQVQVSPDGKWLAYSTDVSGSIQVYVRSFPDGQRRWQVSGDGGFEPKWRGDGSELFYIGPDQQMMSVSIAMKEGVPAFSQPVPLFRASILGAPFQNGFVRNEYAVTRDGQRFLVNEPVGGISAYSIRVLVNWRELLASSRQN